MTDERFRRYRTVLLQLAERFKLDADSVREQACDASGGQAYGGLSNVPMHLADSGTEEYLHELNATLLENEEHLEEEVRDALDRMASGTFGDCQSCGKMIPAVRLETIPFTRYCVDCASVHETQSRVNLNTGRPGFGGSPLVDGERSRKVDGHRGASRAGSERGDHAVGTVGGGAAHGGLAGTNYGHGDPDSDDLELAMGSSDYDAHEPDDEDQSTPRSDASGSAREGTPAERRNP